MDKIMELAVFRYGVINELVTGVLKSGERSDHVKKLAQKLYINPVTGNGIQFGIATIYRYLKRYREGGIEALKRDIRSDTGKLIAIDKEMLDYAIELRKELPSRTTAKIIDILNSKFNKSKIAESTLNYHFERLGYSRRQLKSYDAKIRIRFESEHANHLWIGDYHDRNGLLKNGKEVHLGVWLDCKTRYILHGQYYLKEDLFTLEDGFKKATLKCGCPTLCYVDNAKIYHSKRFEYCCLKLGINPPIFCEAYVPEGKGKIEKWNRYIKENFEDEAVARGGFDTVEELNEHFQAFLELKYQQKVHSETDKIPAEEFESYQEKRYPDISILNELFMLVDPRRVDKKTKTVSVLGVKFVTDSFLQNKNVETHFNPNDLSYVLIYYRNVFIMKALPLKLNTPPEKAKPVEIKSNFKYDYLSALKGEYDKLLRENAALMKVSNIKPLLTDKFYLDDFYGILSSELQRKLSEYEKNQVKMFYETYRPENRVIIKQGLCYGIRQHKNNQHINFYLEIIKLFILAERSKQQ